MVAPVGSPGVLDLPVVVVTVRVLLQTTAIAGVLAGVPPLVDLALANSRIRSGTGGRIRSRVGLRSGSAAIILIGVANKDDSVVKTGSATSILADDTVLVELEDTITSVDGDRHGVSLQLGLNIIDAVSDLAPLGDLAFGFGCVVSALSFSSSSSRGVRIVSVHHDTLLLLEPPGVAHPATIATPEAISLAEERLIVVIVGQGAINELLLGHAHWCSVVLFGDVAFEGRVGSESPA